MQDEIEALAAEERLARLRLEKEQGYLIQPSRGEIYNSGDYTGLETGVIIDAVRDIDLSSVDTTRALLAELVDSNITLS